MGDNEYEDSIEKFKNNSSNSTSGNRNVPMGPNGPNGPNGPMGPNGPNGAMIQQSPEQIAMIQQQRAMQQQAMQQQAMQQQAMQQQAMQQRAMQQNGKYSNKNNKSLSYLDKLKRLRSNETLQEILIIAILFIIFSTAFYRNNLSKIPFVTSENNCLNTAGLLISAILIALIFIIIRIFL